MASQEEIKYWLALGKVPGLGPARLKRLWEHFDSMKRVWEADLINLRGAGLEQKIAEEIISSRREINPDEELGKIEKAGIKIVTLDDANYPRLLKEIYNPPAILYYQGQLTSESDEFAVAVVGTRKYSSYGKQVAMNIVAELTNQGVTTVSGLAIGIDAIVHEATINQKGRTIAVLGSGIGENDIYPSINRYLAKKVIENGGLILSEYGPGTVPIKQNFPQRNRIISGLSVATLIIEAPESSGALLTAKYALEQNRDVMAVPGNIYNANAAGTNNLIKMGAKLVTSANDVLEALNMKQVKKFIDNRKVVPDSQEEALILQTITDEPAHVDEIIKKTGLTTAQVNSTLILMEMKGRVRNLGNMVFAIAR
ncbi:MAG TPA: DNA-processing protein DprA [Patescibacteria group bacterium]|nr:DNA-processing protein DprA [Patescibacteria group bacterium]